MMLLLQGGGAVISTETQSNTEVYYCTFKDNQVCAWFGSERVTVISTSCVAS